MNNFIKKNGFTLIELLAVILILGIIALIAIPTVNDILNESRLSAFNSTATAISNRVEEECQLENLKGIDTTMLYTIVDGVFDKPLEFNGDIPNNGYILINNKCESAYSFYNENNVVSKNFTEKKATVHNKNNAPSYGLEWRSNVDKNSVNYLDDTYKRTLDASAIQDNSVKVQIGDTPVTNAFDELDIYKDILPYTDEFGNEFMLIPKFYISKTKKVKDNEIIWNYAVSKHKLDDTYYLPANFVDEGINNDQYIELPYLLISKYEAGTNGLTGDAERLVSKSGILPKTLITMFTAKSNVEKYNTEDIKGYQLYDIHIHDIISTLFSIEFKTVNSQSILSGMVGNKYEEGPFVTGGSDSIKSSTGTLSNDSLHPIKYRGIENPWGGVLTFTDGVIFHNNVNNATETIDKISDIYVSRNSRNYTIGAPNDSYKLVEGYKKLSFDLDVDNCQGYVSDYNFDPNTPFLSLPAKLKSTNETGTGGYFENFINNGYQILAVGGAYHSKTGAGLFHYYPSWSNKVRYRTLGTRIAKTPLQ